MDLPKNERLIWSGSPTPGWALKQGDWMRLPVSAAFTAFAIYWTWQATAYATPPNLWLLGVPFIVFGLYTLLGRYWLEAQQRNHTTYAVTNRHVIMQCDWPLRRVTAIPIRDIDHVFMNEASDGSGSIVFGMALKNIIPFLPQRVTPKRFSPGFERIAEVKHVYGLIQAAQN